MLYLPFGICPFPSPSLLCSQHLFIGTLLFPRTGIEADHSQTDILSWTNGPKASISLGGYYSSALQLGGLLLIRDHHGTGRL